MADVDGTYGGSADQDLQQRQALLAQLAQAKASGIASGTGNTAASAVQGPPVVPGASDFPGAGGGAGAAVPPADAPAATGMGAYASKMGGFDQSKFADPNRSEKYKIGEVMSRFDPRGGVTPEMLKALNDLGIAEFSGQGDQLTVNNTKNDPRFGKGGTADVVKGLKGNNEDTQWSPWFVDDGGGAGAPQGAGAGPVAGGAGGAMSFLNNDAMSGIMDPGFFQQLMAHAQQQLGPQSTDRKALLAQLGI